MFVFVSVFFFNLSVQFLLIRYRCLAAVLSVSLTRFHFQFLVLLTPAAVTSSALLTPFERLKSFHSQVLHI